MYYSYACASEQLLHHCTTYRPRGHSFLVLALLEFEFSGVGGMRLLPYRRVIVEGFPR